MPDVRIKFCGLTESADVAAALLAGASYLGFVFFPKSPRNLTIDDAAFMAGSVPAGTTKVALLVDPEDAKLDEIIDRVPLDMLQLHGSESPDRVTEIRARYGLPVMKAVGIATEEDLTKVDSYASVADQLLIDAKPPKGADLPGGNGRPFDWDLIAHRDWDLPWMLAGGLGPDNVAEAIRRTGARQVDVSSGVESAPGFKDGQLIRAFAEAVRA
ncbi:phosphoribosylanthranilate isomerase [Palleronia sp. LCG004]|uniref:phosphoribosylanthranilate isomerase n=1 Tax=Palleronia sp. LCG004 TaxID=3079304 RepID=UPI002942C25D|nr:phosphoribosylanthranilate isomerase [Palleronia sp. LCG004]WOI57388.1 phosphoribosylanthranilate isomerase [Palleronia sp. LCG004]